MTPTRALLWALALGLVAWAAWLWPDVPARVPVHFGLGGEPDRWADRSVWSWFGLPLLGLVLTGAFDGITAWSRRHPDAPGLNLPNKAVIVALPPPQRAVVMGRVGDLVRAVGVACLLAFALIQVGVWTTANGADGSGWVLAGVLTTMALPLAALVWGLIRIDAEVKRQQAATSDQPPPPNTP